LAMPGLMERLGDGVVLGAEGYLFELERRGYLKSGPYVPEVVLDHPEAVAELHREFLRAGVEVMVAFTYYGHEEKLRAVGRAGDVEALNRQALRLAREAAAEGDALVAGNICNTWAYDPADPERSGERVRRMYTDQVRWAAEEGADFILSETNDYVGEALIGLEVIREHGLPSVVTFASSEDATIDGHSFEVACKRLEDAGADVVGLNCSRGPATLMPLLERVRGAVSCPVAAQPVPYRTSAEQPTLHSLRDGRLRDGRPRLGRRLYRCVLRRRAPPRPGDGRGPRPHRAGQPLLARPLAAPDPRRRRHDGRALRQLAGRRSVTKHRWVAPLAVGLILLVDRRIWTDDIPLPIKAAADESAHIATTLCLLSLIRPKRPRDFFAGAIVGSVALDVDHLPLYAMYERPSARPGSHSLVTGRACRGPHRTKHRTEKRVPARSVVRAREPSLPRPLDRWCAPLLAAVRTEGDDRRLGAPLAPT